MASQTRKPGRVRKERREMNGDQAARKEGFMGFLSLFDNLLRVLTLGSSL